MSCTVTEGLAIWAAVFVTIRLLIKWGWSDDAIYTNYRRMMAQRTELRIKNGLNPVQLQVLTENAENMRVAMEKLSPPAGGWNRCTRRMSGRSSTDAFTCPWGATCAFYPDHDHIKDGNFDKIDSVRKNEDLVKDSPIHLVIGNTEEFDQKRLHWVYHVIAVCAEHEREAYKGVHKRQSDREIAGPVVHGASYSDSTHLIIF